MIIKCQRCGKGYYEEFGCYIAKCSNCNHMVKIESVGVAIKMKCKYCGCMNAIKGLDGKVFCLKCQTKLVD